MSRTFFRKFLPAAPRAAGRRRSQGSCPSRRRVRYYTLPRRGAGGKPSRTQDADNSSAVERRGTEGIPGGRAPRSGVSPRPIDTIAPGAQRFGSVRMRSRPAVPALRLGPYMEQPRRRGACAPRPSGAAGLAASVQAPARPARGAARFPPSGTPPKKKDGRLRSPPALRAGRPSATVSGRFSLYLYIDMFSSGCRKCA